MSKFDELLKLISTNIEKHGDDAAKILDEVSSPELAVALKGKPREKYLNALDVMQGSKEVRAKDMGFGDKTWYHGTGKDFDQFSDDFLGSVNGKGDTKEQHWVSSNPEVADVFANQAALKQYENEVYKPKSKDFFKRAKEFDSTLKTDAFNNTILGFLNTEKPHLDTFLKFGDITPEQYDAILKFKNEENELRSLSKHRSEKGRGSIIPLKVKEDGIKAIDVNGGYWYDNKDKIGNDEILVKNIKEGTDDIDIPKGDSLAIKDPSKIRSVNAAFDKRFAKSPLLLAGAGAVPLTDNFKNPLDYIKNAASAYETTKNKILKPVASQMDLTKDKSTADDIQSILSAVVDPVNLVNGPVGLGLGAAQMLGEDREKAIKVKTLRKMSGWGANE